MALKVEVNHEHLDKDVEIGINGLPAIPNRGSITLTAEQEEYFAQVNDGQTVKEALKNTYGVKVTGTKEGDV